VQERVSDVCTDTHAQVFSRDSGTYGCSLKCSELSVRVMCHRWLLRRRMRRTESKIGVEAGAHPAVHAVRNYLSGCEHCLVVWGLDSSKTVLCCQAIADGINQAGGLAAWMRCDEMIRSWSSLKQVFLARLGCTTLDDFARLLPHERCEHTWLVFDAVNVWNEDTAGFFKELIECSYRCGKFRVLLFTHETQVACSVLRCSSLQRPIQIVEPIGCCQPTPLRDIQPDAIAAELEMQWLTGIARLTRFVREEWTQSGAFTAGPEALEAIRW
jgi:hypothetical protein